MEQGGIGTVGFSGSKNEKKVFAKAEARSLTSYHNHHYNTGFSPNDIEVLVNQSSIGTSVVVCNNGDIHKLSCKKVFKSIQESVINDYKNLLRKYKRFGTIMKKMCELYDLEYVYTPKKD